MQLSTAEMQSSFISVLLFIISILKNSAKMSRIEMKERTEEPLRKASLEHFAEGFLVGSIRVASRKFEGTAFLNKLNCCEIRIVYLS